jgi:hypothetical protein
VKRQAKVAVATAPGAGSVGDQEPEATAAEVPTDEVEPDATAVTAGRPSPGPGAPRPVSGPRQQPRRSSASQRRPSGKKKRR